MTIYLGYLALGRIITKVPHSKKKYFLLIQWVAGNYLTKIFRLTFKEPL